VDRQTDRQTERHTDMLIAILWPPNEGKVTIAVTNPVTNRLSKTSMECTSRLQRGKRDLNFVSL